MCEANIWGCDVMIQFTEHDSLRNGSSRGGRHVELGLAFARQKQIYIVGPPEHDFHHLMNMGRFAQWSSRVLLILEAEKTHLELKASTASHSITVAQCGACLKYDEDKSLAGQECQDECLTPGGAKAKMRRRSGDICYVCRFSGKEDFFTEYDRPAFFDHVMDHKNSILDADNSVIAEEDIQVEALTSARRNIEDPPSEAKGDSGRQGSAGMMSLGLLIACPAVLLPVAAHTGRAGKAGRRRPRLLALEGACGAGGAISGGIAPPPYAPWHGGK